MDLLKTKTTMPITCPLNKTRPFTLCGKDVGYDRNAVLQHRAGPCHGELQDCLWLTEHHIPLAWLPILRAWLSNFSMWPRENSGDIQIDNPQLLRLNSHFRPGMVDLEIYHLEQLCGHLFSIHFIF